MSNVIANNPGQILNSAEGRLYMSKSLSTKGQLLITKEITEAEGNFNIAEKIFGALLGNNKKELELLKAEIEKLKEKINIFCRRDHDNRNANLYY